VSQRNLLALFLTLLLAPFPVLASDVFGTAVQAENASPETGEGVHFLIPAGPGGGLDSTARALGRVLTEENLAKPVSYENMSGGGGGRAMSHFIETAPRQKRTLLVNSTPLLVRSLQGLFPQSHRDLVAIAGLIAEASVLAVRADSDIVDLAALIASLSSAPRRYTVGGGSVRGSFDHIAAALILQAAGVPPRGVRYLPYDGGGKAMLALLGGEVDVLSTGLGEVLSYVASGDVRILAIAADRRNPMLPDAPTLTELGYPVVFSNWRGLFAAPGASAASRDRLIQLVRSATASEAWRQALTRYGWQSQLLLGEDFRQYLNAQEAQLASVMRDLGFLD